MKYLLSEHHLAASEIIFHVSKGYNGTVRMLVMSNLCKYLAIIGSSIRAINISNSSPIGFNILDNDYNISTVKKFTKSVLKKGKYFLQVT